MTTMELRRKLEEAEERERWEQENPQAIKDAYDRGQTEGWSAGWQAAMQFTGQWALRVADIQRTKAPEPTQVSLERIASFLDEQRGFSGT